MGRKIKEFPKRQATAPHPHGEAGGGGEDSHVLEEELRAQDGVPGVLLPPGHAWPSSSSCLVGEGWAATQATWTMALRQAVSYPLNGWLTLCCP